MTTSIFITAANPSGYPVGSTQAVSDASAFFMVGSNQALYSSTRNPEALAPQQVAAVQAAGANGGGNATPGLVSVNPAADITANYTLVAADFGAGLRRVNSATPVVITVPSIATLGFAATAGQERMAMFDNVGAGALTFAGAAAGQVINGIAGPTAAALSTAQYGQALLKQLAVGSDAWSLS